MELKAKSRLMRARNLNGPSILEGGTGGCRGHQLISTTNHKTGSSPIEIKPNTWHIIYK